MIENLSLIYCAAVFVFFSCLISALFSLLKCFYFHFKVIARQYRKYAQRYRRSWNKNEMANNHAFFDMRCGQRISSSMWRVKIEQVEISCLNHIFPYSLTSSLVLSSVSCRLFDLSELSTANLSCHFMFRSSFLSDDSDELACDVSDGGERRRKFLSKIITKNSKILNKHYHE